MEIVFQNVSTSKISKMNLKLGDHQIIGVLEESPAFLELLSFKTKFTGKIQYAGKSISYSTSYQLKKDIFFVSQEETLFPLATVLEQIRFYFLKRNMKKEGLEKRIRDAFRIVGLKVEILNRHYDTLSFSEKQFLRLAIAIIPNSKVLLLEEPFLGLDERNRKKMWTLFQKMSRKYGKTILFSSKDVEMVSRYSDSCVIFVHNHCIKDGKTKKIFTESVESLKKLGLILPQGIEFIYFAKKKKKVKLMYQLDILDIMKDVYKHVPTK